MESKIAQIKTNGFLDFEKSKLTGDKWEFRKKFANMAINLWLLAEGSDHYRTKIERGKVLDFIKNLFTNDSLFSPNELDETKRKEILLELVGMKTEIPPLTTVCDFIKMNKEISRAFYFDACLIIHLDGRVVNTEQKFLDEMKQFLGLSSEDCSKILMHFAHSNK
jgi:tellurite resistance protein